MATTLYWHLITFLLPGLVHYIYILYDIYLCQHFLLIMSFLLIYSYLYFGSADIVKNTLKLKSCSMQRLNESGHFSVLNRCPVAVGNSIIFLSFDNLTSVFLYFNSHFQFGDEVLYHWLYLHGYFVSMATGQN